MARNANGALFTSSGGEVNTTPHTHRIEITHEQGSELDYWRVSYGDTTIHCYKWMPFRKFRLTAATRRAIRRHDRGTQRAGERVDLANILEERYQAHLIGEAKVKEMRPDYSNYPYGVQEVEVPANIVEGRWAKELI
jgi:hypothetical protein